MSNNETTTQADNFKANADQLIKEAEGDIYKALVNQEVSLTYTGTVLFPDGSELSGRWVLETDFAAKEARTQADRFKANVHQLTEETEGDIYTALVNQGVALSVEGGAVFPDGSELSGRWVLETEAALKPQPAIEEGCVADETTGGH